MKEMIDTIKKAGGNLYLVGGAVRDRLMGEVPSDRDFCVTGLSVEQFSFLFPEAEEIGKEFPVFRIQGEEFALARTERKTEQGHRGFEVISSPEVTIEEDLRRRDLTVNAIAVNLDSGEIVDPFGGVEDLQAGILRAVSDAYVEDPFRVYRTARFAARFGFILAPKTEQMMKSMKGELSSLPVERVTEELRKALRSPWPSVFFRVLAEAEVLDVHFAEIANLVGVPQPEKHHPEGDAFEHSMQVLDAMAKQTEEEVLRWVAATHDLGKAVTPKEILPRHHGHEKAGVPLVLAISERLKLPRRFVEAAKVGAAEHMTGFRCQEMRPGKLVRFLERVRKSPLGLEGLALLVRADHRGRNNPNESVPEADVLVRLSSVVFSINGKQINAKPGPQFGQRLFEARVEAVKMDRVV